ALLLEFDQVLGFGLDQTLRDWRLEMRDSRANRQSLISHLPDTIAALVDEREALRREKCYAEADALRARVGAAGYALRDTRAGPLVERLAPEQEFPTITRSADVADMRGAADLYEFSVNLLARDSRDYLERCVRSIAHHCAGHSLEVVIVDNGSTDDTLP